MKIAFDAKRIFSNQTGLGNYSRTLVDNLKRYYANEDYLLFTPRITETENKYDQQFKTITPTATFKHIWRSYSIKKDLEREEVDIYHGLSNEIPFWLKNTKTIVTIHDVIFKALPHTYPQLDRWLYEEKTRYACKYADAIIAISEYTKQDLVNYYNVEPERIKVIYQACQAVFYESTNLLEQNANTNFLENLPTEFILSVGSIIERKNLLNLVKAIGQMPEKNRIPLVIVGKGNKYRKRIENHIQAKCLNKWFYWIDNLTSVYTLKKLYQRASLFVYPSLYEGFGLPVVEAMLCGTPVITSNVTSLPEAGGKYALLVNPNKVDEMSSAIYRVLTDSVLKKELSEKGKKEAFERFNPKKLTEEMMSIYQSIT